MNDHLTLLNSLRYPNGLFAASAKHVSTGYQLSWIRDNVYCIFGYEALGRHEDVRKTLHALLDIFHKHRYKIQWMIKEPHPKESYRYIHARYDPHTGDEIWEHWGNKQNDAIGLFLFKIGTLESQGVSILRDDEDRSLIQELADYLTAIEYWHDTDHGIWENEEEVHASSVGACVAGLRAVRTLVTVSDDAIMRGEQALRSLLPAESVSRPVDLAQLTLIYPFQVVDDQMRDEILRNVEQYLVRDKGVIRYFGDWYYAHDGIEAQWVFGLIWLAIIYHQLGELHKYRFYLQKAADCMTPDGALPELYVNGTEPNENTPLGWAQSLWIVAEELGKK